MATIFSVGSFSRPGRDTPNQDRVMEPISVGGFLWAGIADGIGGSPGGDVASREAISAVRGAIERDPTSPMERLFSIPQRKRAQLATSDVTLARMGTTLSILRLADGEAELGHVGDSRVYHIRGNGIITRTKDQTEAQALVDQGIITKDQVRRYARRNVLLSAVAADKSYELAVSHFSVEDDDKIVLATDGVHGVVQTRELPVLLRDRASAQEAAEVLEGAVSSRVPTDDYSAVVIWIQRQRPEASQEFSRSARGVGLR